MKTHLNLYRDALLLLADAVYHSNLPVSTKTKLLNVYKKTDQCLMDDLIFYTRVEENKNLIVRSGNKITITIPDTKNKKNASAYIFAQGIKKRYDALQRKN